MRRLIGVLILAEWENNFPNEVREFLDRFEIVRRIIPHDQDGTIYWIQHKDAPEIKDYDVIQILAPRMVTGEYMKVIYI